MTAEHGKQSTFSIYNAALLDYFPSVSLMVLPYHKNFLLLEF